MYTITKLKQTCSGYPSQWEGKTKHDTYVFIHYRYGIFRIEEAETKEEWYDNGKFFKEIVNLTLGDELGGIITNKGLLDILKIRGIKITDQEFLNDCN